MRAGPTRVTKALPMNAMLTATRPPTMMNLVYLGNASKTLCVNVSTASQHPVDELPSHGSARLGSARSNAHGPRIIPLMYSRPV